MNEEQAKKTVETLLPLQEKGGDPFPCPRCGHKRMKPEAVANALSRRANVYICSECGMDEAVLDMKGKPPKPFSEWSLPMSMDSNGKEEKVSIRNAVKDDSFFEQQGKFCSWSKEDI